MTVDRQALSVDRDSLLERLEGRLRAGGREWLAEALRRVAADAGALAPAFAAAGRKAGRALLFAAPAPEPRRLRPGGPVLDPWSVDDAARVALLLEDAIRDLPGAGARGADLYGHGELRERVAVVRGLQLVPAGEAGVAIVRDALRSNARDLFAAAVCENTFTSDALADDLLFQAVLKCAFVELPLGRVERLAERATPELARMLYAYVTERDAAGRPVPGDLWPVIALFPPAGSEARLARAGVSPRGPVAGGGRLPE